MTSDELIEHCETICETILESDIHNKVVVLCEGDIPAKHARTVSGYRQQAKWPDASFYKACIPIAWSQKVPKFFNCGGRAETLQTYEQIKQYMLNPPEERNFPIPKAVFALVDADIQSGEITENFSTEQRFQQLYQACHIQPNKLEKRHDVWVTGLIHKEAYFLLPEMQAILDKYTEDYYKAYFEQELLDFNKAYQKLADSIAEDKDLEHNLQTAQTAQQRLNGCKQCEQLDWTDLKTLQQSWHKAYQQAQTKEQKKSLIDALLTITKAKQTVWQEIYPAPDYTLEPETYREQLAIEIATEGFSKKLSKMLFNNNNHNHTDSGYHIPQLLKQLYQVSFDASP